MMNVGDQNGLEAWRLLVRSEQPVSGANRIAAMQSILKYKFSPGFDKLEEELRKFEGLLKMYHAVFGEGISDSITQAVIKSQMPADIRHSSRAANLHSNRRSHQSHILACQR